VLLNLAERVGRRLRAKHRSGRCVTARIRFADFETISRSVTLPAPVCTTDALYRTGRDLTHEALASEARGLRLLGISVSLIETAPPLQLELGLDGDGLGPPVTRAGSKEDLDRRALDAAVDLLRERYGADAVARAALLRVRREPTLHELSEHSLDRDDDG
jgi:DNA polymerase-4